MNLLDLVTAPWAILPDKLVEIQAIYATHLRGDKIDLAAVEARLGRPLGNDQQRYTVREGGVAVLPMIGVMAPRANLFMDISGGVSTQMMTRQVESLRADSRVKSVVMRVDSPGGSVYGLPALADELQLLAAEKPLVTVVEGGMSSAAYWTGSAANAIFLEGVTDQVGSIGVYTRVGWNKRSENELEMTRGKYKRVSLNGAPPDPDVLAHIDEQLDYLYTSFVERVAAHRGVTPQVVLERMAEGRNFWGQQAIDAGLADGFATVEDLVEQLATDPTRYAARRVAKPKALAAVPAQAEADPPALAAGAAAEAGPQLEEAGAADASATTTPPTAEKEPTMGDITREALERDHPALFASLRSEFTAAGAAAERDRITAVRAQSLRGHEQLIETLAFDGKTTGPEAAMAVNAAVRAQQEAAAAAHKADAPNAVPGGAAPADAGGKKTREQQAAEASAYAAANKVDFVTAIKQLGFDA